MAVVPITETTKDPPETSVSGATTTSSSQGATSDRLGMGYGVQVIETRG
jgi:hypothetical protein